MLKLIFVFITLAVLATPEGLQAQELRDADDVLWLLDRDRRNLSVEYQRILTVLDASKVPNADRARDIAIRFKLAHGGLRAEEGPKVVGLLRIGRDLPPFATEVIWCGSYGYRIFGSASLKRCGLAQQAAKFGRCFQ